MRLTVIRLHYKCDNILEIGRVRLPLDNLMVLELDGFYFGVFPVFAQLNSVNRNIRDGCRFVCGEKNKRKQNKTRLKSYSNFGGN